MAFGKLDILIHWSYALHKNVLSVSGCTVIWPPVCLLSRFPVATQNVISKTMSDKLNMAVNCTSLKGFTTVVTWRLEYIIKLAYWCNSANLPRWAKRNKEGKKTSIKWVKQEKKTRGKERARFVSTAEGSRQVKVEIVSRCHELGRNLHRHC